MQKVQSREFWCFSMHPSPLIISFSCFVYSLHSFSCFVYSLHSLLSNDWIAEVPSFWDLLPNIWLWRNLPRADLSSNNNVSKSWSDFSSHLEACTQQHTTATFTGQLHSAQSFTATNCLIKHVDSAWFSICLAAFLHKGQDWSLQKKEKTRSTTSYIGCVLGTGTHLDSFDSCLLPFQRNRKWLREASSQKAHGPEIDPQLSSNCHAVNMPYVLLPSCHWMSLWCLRKADQELEGCNHLQQASQEAIPQNSQFWRCKHCINTFERWPHQHTLQIETKLGQDSFVSANFPSLFGCNDQRRITSGRRRIRHRDYSHRMCGPQSNPYFLGTFEKRAQILLSDCNGDFMPLPNYIQENLAYQHNKTWEWTMN